MSGTVLTLGPVVFRDFEIPSAISFGGHQRMAVRYLTNGQRVTDLLGPDDAAISFSGVLSGPNASSRAQQIDALRTVGQPLNLSWGDFLYTVVIETFSAAFANQSWIPYTIRCSILSNPNAVTAGIALSGIEAALSSLNILYSSVPTALLPVSDPRALLTPNPTNVTPNQVSAAAAVLQQSAVALTAAQLGQEALLTKTPLSGGPSVSVYPRIFATMSAAAANIQFMAFAQDCLGSAVVQLSQAR